MFSLTRPGFLTLLILGLFASSFVYFNAALTGLLLLALILVTARGAMLARTWTRLPLSVWMLICLCWLGISATASAVPSASLFAAWTLAGLPVAYLAWSIMPDSERVWSRLRIAFWLAGVCMAAWGLWQVRYHIGNGSAVGPLIDRNAFAALINILWFLAAYLFLTSRGSVNRWRPVVLGIGLFVLTAGLFATESRGGIATWLLLLPVLVWAGYRHAPSRRFIVMIPFIALAAYLTSTHLVGASVANRTYDLVQDGSTNARILMWKSTLQMILVHPLTGTGWGTFAGYYPAYRSPLENTTTGLFAHNDYLQLAAEGGVPALVLQLGLLVGLLLQLRRSLRLAGTAHGLESVALLLGGLALFIHAGVNFIFYFAFMNILTGLYLARAAQLVDPIARVSVPNIDHISPRIKNLLSGFIVLLLAGPLVIHIVAQGCLTGVQPGLKVLNLVAPRLNGYDIARLLSAVRPQEAIAQEVMLQVSEHALADGGRADVKDADMQRELLKETLDRFDFVRAQTANSPNLGVREVKLLLANPGSLGPDVAYAKAQEVLRDNLAADPYDANSMIELARLQTAEGRRADGLQTLQRAAYRVLTRRDQQLIAVEVLRELAAPRVIAELDNLEQQLRNVHSESEMGHGLQLAPHFSEDIDARLKAIAEQLKRASS
ncbi:MAG: O-antigen ligase family protein [Thiobacillaceae bacterium]